MITVVTNRNGTFATFTELVTIEDAKKAGSFFDSNNNLLATVLKRTDISWSDISGIDKFGFSVKTNRYDLSKFSYMRLELFYYEPNKGFFDMRQGRYDYRKINLDLFEPFTIRADCRCYR